MLLAPSLRRPTIEQNGRQNDRSLYTSCAPWLTVQKRSFVQNGSNTSLASDVATACWRLAWDDKHLTFSLQIHLDALFDLSWFLTVQYAPERLTPFVPHWFYVRITKDNISKLHWTEWRICMFKSKVNNLRSLICSRRDTRRKQYFCSKIKIQSSWKNWR